MKKYRVLHVLVILLIVSCSSKSPEEKLVRNFLDEYYVMANLEKSLDLTVGQAEKELKKEIELVKGVSNQGMAYKTRDIVFDLKKKLETKDDATFLYELTLYIPKIEERKQLVHIVVDKKLKKIKFFGNLK